MRIMTRFVNKWSMICKFYEAEPPYLTHPKSNDNNYRNMWKWLEKNYWQKTDNSVMQFTKWELIGRGGGVGWGWGVLSAPRPAPPTHLKPVAHFQIDFWVYSFNVEATASWLNVDEWQVRGTIIILKFVSWGWGVRSLNIVSNFDW